MGYLLTDDAVIPGMGPEDKVEFTESLTADKGFIPGLDLDAGSRAAMDRDREKKVPYSKPIPRNFQVQWAGPRRADDPSVLSIHDELAARESKDSSNGLTHQQISENTLEGILASGMLNGLDPQTIVGVFVYGRFIRVHPDSRLMVAIRQGSEYLNKYIDAGKLEELRDVVPVRERERERSRSLSPPVEAQQPRGEVSPPLKKSRFEPRQHNAQLVCVRELLLLKKPFLPSLLTVKAQQPKTEFIDDPTNYGSGSPMDQATREDGANRPNPWANNAPWSNYGNGNNGGGSGPSNQNGYGNNGGGGGDNYNDRDRDPFQKGGGGGGGNNGNNINNSGQQRRRRGNNNSGGGGGGGGAGGGGGGRNRGRNSRRF